MAKQNNSLTELQALEGIYEHLSTIDDLAKEVGAISTRLRKIEERLKEPMDITDPILGKDLTRDTCIYGALAKSMEACREVKEQKVKLNDITAELKQVRSLLERIRNGQERQEDLHKKSQAVIKELGSDYRTYFIMILIIVLVITVATIVVKFI